MFFRARAQNLENSVCAAGEKFFTYFVVKRQKMGSHPTPRLQNQVWTTLRPRGQPASGKSGPGLDQVWTGGLDVDQGPNRNTGDTVAKSNKP